ncbi:ACP S-malonyltransferase [Aurantivibrio infirmus]
MLALVFPGQGSQSKGMASELFDSVPEYARVESEVDELLGYSMRRLCLDDPNEELNQTQFTQPALYVANALHYFSKKAEGITASYFAGHSLGEYNALLAAGAFDFMSGLKLVQKRGELMSQAKDGGMAALIGIDGEKIRELLVEHGLDAVDIANFNSPAQTVLSGPVLELERGQTIFKEAGAKLYKVLPVSAAFHSRYMKSAAEEFAAFIAGFSFSELQTPVVANVTGKPYESASAIPGLLVRQISGSVQWTQSIRYLKAAGVDTFEEAGPGKVLTKLIKQID